MPNVYLYRIRKKPAPRKSMRGRQYYQLVSSEADIIDAQTDDLEVIQRQVEQQPQLQNYVAANFLGTMFPLDTHAGANTTTRRHVLDCIRWSTAGKPGYVVFEDRTPRLFNYTGKPVTVVVGGLPAVVFPPAGAALTAAVRWSPRTLTLTLAGTPAARVLSSDIEGVEVGELELSYCAPLPEDLLPADYAIVNLPYARAYRWAYGDDDRLLCPAEAVVTEDEISCPRLYHPAV